MKGKNMILLSVAVIAIGLFVLPQTMAMFVGQHSWYSVRTVEKQYDLCYRCHEAEVCEWESNTGAHSQYAEDNPNDGCFCHQINSSQLSTDWNLSSVADHGFKHFNASGDVKDKGNWTWRPATTPHAALVVECIDCHQNAVAQLENEHSAHRPLFVQARNSSGVNYEYNNSACLACHTMIGLNITLERSWSGLNLVANHTNYTSTGWEVNVTLNETERTSNATFYPPNVSVTVP